MSQRVVSWTNEPINILGITVTYATDDLMNLNYGMILQKIKSTLKSWSKRNLSLFGKIVILHTLIVSLFVHKMMVLPSISEAIVLEVEKEMVQFIWNGHKPKIPLRILQKSRLGGGAQLVDLHDRVRALKITWIKCLEDDRQLAAIAYELINPILGKDIWECALHSEDVKYVMSKQTSLFWFDTL